MAKLKSTLRTHGSSVWRSIEPRLMRPALSLGKAFLLWAAKYSGTLTNNALPRYADEREQVCCTTTHRRAAFSGFPGAAQSSLEGVFARAVH